MNISEGNIAFIDYELLDLDNQILFSEEMFPYLFGSNEILIGMKKALEGKRVGDHIDVEISASDAFGERVQFEPIIVNKNEFGPSFDRLTIGTALTSQSDGSLLYVQKITPEYAQLSTNHPLAGHGLKFKAHIKHIRVASQDEMSLGYPLSLSGVDTNSGSCSCC
ncbi:MAG: hypothetical protein VXZ96_02860 [Myxococcota bacterium]|nr:hypothetical protein [Myxococcota bacterium]MEC8379231.1 hypothetical protein [Myxococcota bacterium]